MRIREIREERELSQKELAAKMQVSPTNIYNYETGRTEPSIEVLLKLSQILNVSVDYLIGREDSDVQPSATNRSTDQLTAKEKRLLKAFTSLPELEKNKLIEDAEFYALRHVKQEQH